MQKNELDHQLTLYLRINSKWIKDLNVSCETIKIPEENKSIKILNISGSSIFADISPRSREIKGKKPKWDYIKLKSMQRNLSAQQRNQQN